MKNVIDHFVIGADSLEQGEEALQKLLGVTVPRGGKHDAMSTHNCVMQSGNRTFLEILSIDPDAPAPGRVRWFSMDEAETQQRLAERPRALCWVVGTDDLDAVVAASRLIWAKFWNSAVVGAHGVSPCRGTGICPRAGCCLPSSNGRRVRIPRKGSRIWACG